MKLHLTQSCAERAERKDQKPGVIEVLAAEHVSQAANNRHQRGGDQQIPEQHPHDGQEACFEPDQNVWQRDQQSRPLQRRQQGA